MDPSSGRRHRAESTWPSARACTRPSIAISIPPHPMQARLVEAVAWAQDGRSFYEYLPTEPRGSWSELAPLQTAGLSEAQIGERCWQRSSTRRPRRWPLGCTSTRSTTPCGSARIPVRAAGVGERVELERVVAILDALHATERTGATGCATSPPAGRAARLVLVASACGDAAAAVSGGHLRPGRPAADTEVLWQMHERSSSLPRRGLQPRGQAAVIGTSFDFTAATSRRLGEPRAWRRARRRMIETCMPPSSATLPDAPGAGGWRDCAQGATRPRLQLARRLVDAALHTAGLTTSLRRS